MSDMTDFEIRHGTIRVAPGETLTYPTTQPRRTMTTRAGRKNLATILKDAAAERDTSVRAMEDVFEEAFLANRQSVGTYDALAEAISTAINLPITRSHVYNWMKHYGYELERKASPRAELEQLRERNAELTNQFAELQAENELLRTRNRQLVDALREIANSIDAWLFPTTADTRAEVQPSQN